MGIVVGRMNIRITKYGNRNWAVWIGEELLAVTVYRKGARAISDLLMSHGLGTTLPDSSGKGRLEECSDEHSNEHPARALQLPGAA
jgi:hypothetical protein